MYRPPLRHVRPHMATGVDIGPRPRASGDIGLIAAASAPVRLSPINMAVASPYFSSSLRMTDLSDGRAPPRHYDPEGKASQPCRPNVEPGLKQALVLALKSALFSQISGLAAVSPPVFEFSGK